MRTIKFIPLYILSSLLLVYGCKKEKETTVNQEPTEVQNLISLSDAYIAEQTPMKALPKWLKIVGADLGGAVTGAGIGAGVGSVVPGLGTGAGAIIGGVAGGASASIEEAGSVAPSGNANGVGGLPANLNNPYNSVGELHYSALHAYRASGGDSDVASSYPYLVSKISNYYGYSEQTIESTFTLEECEQQVQRATQNAGNGAKAFIIDLYNQGSISTRTYDVLAPYASAIDASNPQDQSELDDFVEYSISAENIVVNSNFLSDEEEAQVLIYMATARYGMQYWYQYR